ncbi:MAG: YidC/Oxa1 family insertase periplasmic-domain containing protein [Phycisphaeraceae bacterium]|nr:YidC/Oxa1 family insertase periplasmic-domain containing protein [Phycisphaeraceae bacterium]
MRFSTTAVVSAWLVGLVLATSAMAQTTQPADAAPMTLSAMTTPVSPYHVPRGDEPVAVELGSLDKDSGYRLKVGLERGALWYIRLTNYLFQAMTDGAKPSDHYLILSKIADPLQPGAFYRPLTLRGLWINDSAVPLAGAQWKLIGVEKDEHDTPWRASYSLPVLDERGRTVLEVRRTFELAADSYEVVCRQELVNHSDRPLNVASEWLAQPDAPHDAARYMGDQRTFVAGYYDLDWNPTGTLILSANGTVHRPQILSGKQTLWPRLDLVKGAAADPSKIRLGWLGATNRYFALVLHRPVTIDPAKPIDARQVEPLDEKFAYAPPLIVGQEGIGAEGQDLRHIFLTLRSKPVEVPAGGEKNLDLSLFAGPRESELFSQPVYEALHFGELVRYSVGCTWCLFQGLAKFLLGFLKLIHAFTFDWGVAVIALVVAVRAILHPLTRHSQIHMTKFQKQMASLQPEIEKLKKKYENDPRKLQTEQAKLMREKGVSPAGMLGCLPMFLQMPIWIALYAMLYGAIELRHQPAFWGLFQSISGGKWHFLSDLSSPDAFIRFSDRAISIPHDTPIFGSMLGALDFSVLNILPILWAVTLYFQQKLMTPPAMNDQARQTQKMMGIMMWFMALLFYSAPSGLTLYILASTGAGILDSYIVKKHIQREEEAGTLYARKEVRPGSLRDRIGKAIAAKQKDLQNVQRRLEGGPGESRYKKR